MDNTTRSRRSNRRSLSVAALTVVLIITGAWLLTSRDSESTAKPSADGKIIEEFAPGDRTTVADFTGSMLDGSTFESSQIRGRVAVFNVWGSWCGPCRTEAPDLSRLARETAGETMFVGINLRDNDDAARAFERSFEIPYSSITTADSAPAVLAFGRTLSASAVPSTVVVDPEGRVAARVVGPVTYSTLKALVFTVLAEGTSGGR